MGGYCGDSYYRTKEEYRKMMRNLKIFLVLLVVVPAALIYFSPLFY